MKPTFPVEASSAGTGRATPPTLFRQTLSLSTPTCRSLTVLHRRAVQTAHILTLCRISVTLDPVKEPQISTRVITREWPLLLERIMSFSPQPPALLGIVSSCHRLCLKRTRPRSVRPLKKSSGPLCRDPDHSSSAIRCPLRQQWERACVIEECLE